MGLLKLSHTEKILWYEKTCKKMLRLYKQGWTIEFVSVKELWSLREFDRSLKSELKYSIVSKGLEEPVMILYYAGNRRAYIGEGNHRLVVAKSVGIEALPARVVRSQSTTTKGIRVKGFEPDWSGYVPGSLYPSDIGLRGYSLKKLCA